MGFQDWCEISSGQCLEDNICDPPVLSICPECSLDECLPGEPESCGSPECPGYQICQPDGSWGECISDDCNSVCDYINHVCVVDLEAGNVFCTSNEDCQTHFSCNAEEKKCVEVPGEGIDQCSTDDDCKNNAPVAHSLDAFAPNYCSGIPGAGLAIFQWVYYDPDDQQGTDQSQNEAQFELQIDDSNDFSSPEVYRSVMTAYSGIKSGDSQQQLVLVKINDTIPCASSEPPPFGCGDYIKFNTPYFWRVRVADQQVAWSEWTYYDYDPSTGQGSGTVNPGGATSYTYAYAHPAPAPFYIYSPEKPEPKDTVYFTDQSICYDSFGLISCQSLENCAGGHCYIWSFGDSSPNDYTMGDVSHIYEKKGNYNSSLTVCDDIGCCSAVRNIPVGVPSGGDVPQWQEITPF